MSRQSSGRTSGLALLAFLFLLAATMPSAQGQEIPITTKSPEARALLLKARQAQDDLQLQAAREYLNQAIAADPDFALAYFQRVFTGENYAELMADVRKAEELSGAATPAEQLFIQSMAMMVRGESLDKRQAIAEKLISMYPSSEDALYTIAGIYGERGDLRKQLEYQQKVAELKPGKGSVFNALGGTRMAMGDFEGAAREYHRYVELSPGIPNSHDSYAEALLQLGRFDESISEYQRALQIDPNFLFSVAGVGTNYVFMGEYGKGREYYRQVATKAPDFWNKQRARGMIANSYLYEGQIEEAVRALQELSQKYVEAGDPSAAWSLYNASMVLVEAGRAKEGLSWIDRAVALADSLAKEQGVKDNAAFSAAACRARAFVADGRLSEARTEAGKVRTYAEKLNDRYHTSIMHLTNGLIESRAGNESAALGEFNQADPQYPAVLYYRGLSLRKTGKQEEARASFQKIADRHDIDSFALALYRGKALQALGPVQAGHQEDHSEKNR